MATYDLEQQEQLDQFKHFWKQYGNLITWVLVLALGAYAAWSYYLYWQQQRGTAAAALYEELDRAALTGNADKVAQIFGDMKDKYAGATFTEQGALLAAKVEVDNKKVDEGKATLQWLVSGGKNANLVAVARLRLAGLQMDAKQYDEALKTLSGDLPADFVPLADDRRGDILMAQGKKEEAAKAYLAAWKGVDATVEYRRFIESKLTALGQPPAPLRSKVAPEGAGAAAGMPPGLAPTN
ncbi:MAG TPA: tetratricopeptide repeat protein [Aquabacterium sp.]|uniref:YfgM family protein n=1 Tax=Aquabacterium sp. TaxID=1872578 RepID=UPI002E34A2DF|nr:tetratricopeptide repeat protein [Aquabacterium sp.]HEX5357900.1 tetratricopeptide repeat protein [Aquabacterium sp.]